MHTDTHTHAQGIVRVSVIFRGSAINYPRERKYIPEKKKRSSNFVWAMCSWAFAHLLGQDVYGSGSTDRLALISVPFCLGNDFFQTVNWGNTVHDESLKARWCLEWVLKNLDLKDWHAASVTMCIVLQRCGMHEIGITALTKHLQRKNHPSILHVFFKVAALCIFRVHFSHFVSSITFYWHFKDFFPPVKYSTSIFTIRYPQKLFMADL